MPPSEQVALDRSRSSSPVSRVRWQQTSSGSSPSTTGIVQRLTNFKPKFMKRGYEYVWENTADRVIRLAFLLYSLLLFCLFGLRALIEGCILKKPGQQFWAELVAERTRLWDLRNSPSHGLEHAFCTLSNGRKLHYLTNQLDTKFGAKRKNLIIFIHGWPDSCMVWRDVINRLPLPAKESTTLVAVDLPGFGGSDSLARYSAGQVVSTLFEFILAMRNRWLKDNTDEEGKRIGQGHDDASTTQLKGGHVLIVAHDWGAICAFQLASRAPQLADRFILCNSVLPQLVRENIAERRNTASKIYYEWKRDCSGKVLPTKALGPLLPLFRQLFLSSYIFIFNLPDRFAEASIQRCNLWAMRLLSSWAVGYGTIMHTPKVVSDIAGFLGPNVLTCDTHNAEDEGYAQSVHFRAWQDVPTETLRYYREGLATHVWRRKDHHAQTLYALDLENHNDRGKKLVGALETWPPGKLNMPTTIIWGERDPALDSRLALEGIHEYLTADSQVVRLPKVGHWVQLEGEGPAALVAVIEWALDQKLAGTLTSKVKAACVSAKVAVYN